MFPFPAGVRRTLAAALAVASCNAAGLAAQTAAPPPPYRVGWGDAASVTAAATIALFGARTAPPLSMCAPCDRADLPGIDRGTVDLRSGFARTASDVALVGVAGGALLAAVSGVGPARARGDAVVLANAVAWTAAATEWLKVGVHRARPALYRDGAVEAATHASNRKSFPSGHTSTAFATAVAYTTLAQRQRLPHATRNSLLLLGGATSVGALRVIGGKHFPTDVLAGAALGSGIGWLVARLHPTTPTP
ncbi:MAG TPA: phosphatase PAP2 family protein [Gemmatimonadales bacterium]